MKTAAATFLLVGILAAHQAYGEAVSVQPLTRVDCSRAAMAWDESANVCGANSRDLSGQPLTRLDCVKAGMKWNDSANVCGTTPAAVTILKPDARDESSQPLARNQCEMAGLRWNDQANVCGEPAGAATQVATSPAAPTVLISIDKTATAASYASMSERRPEADIELSCVNVAEDTGASLLWNDGLPAP
jgi:hypothetical protein